MKTYIVVAVHVLQYYPSGEAEIIYAGTNEEAAQLLFKSESAARDEEEWSVWMETWENGRKIS